MNTINATSFINILILLELVGLLLLSLPQAILVSALIIECLFNISLRLREGRPKHPNFIIIEV
jgi:hypothetical protein